MARAKQTSSSPPLRKCKAQNLYIYVLLGQRTCHKERKAQERNTKPAAFLLHMIKGYCTNSLQQMGPGTVLQTGSSSWNDSGLPSSTGIRRDTQDKRHAKDRKGAKERYRGRKGLKLATALPGGGRCAGSSTIDWTPARGTQAWPLLLAPLTHMAGRRHTHSHNPAFSAQR